MLPDLKQEQNLWRKGFKYIVGIDEVGRGSWAGPLVAAGVILPINYKVPKNLKDSKLLSPKQRLILDNLIKEEAISYYITQISHNIINKIGIAKATQIAFGKIAQSIEPKANFCLIDAFCIKNLNPKKQRAIIKGDMKCASIAAASIVAKVYRDNLMENISRKYARYGFDKHKGYGTKEHQLAIKTYGFSNLHRTSFNLSYLFK